MVSRVPELNRRLRRRPQPGVASRRVGAALIAVALTGSVLAPPAGTATDEVLDEDYLEARLNGDALLHENRQGMAATEQQIQQASIELDGLAATATELQAAIVALDAQIAVVEADYRVHLDAQAQAIRDAVRVRDEVAAAEAEVRWLEDLVTERAVAAYVSPIREPRAVPYLRSTDLTELQRKVALLEVVTDHDGDVLDELAAARDALDDELAHQDYREAKAHDARARLADVRSELDARRADKERLEDELAGKIEAQQSEIAALEAARAELERIIATREARFRAEAQQRAEWRERCAAGETPVDDAGAVVDCGDLDDPLPPSSMSWPSAAVVSSEYGPRWGRMHEGIDLAGATGTPITAAEDGMVFYAGWLGGYGNTTIIDHGGGVMTLYGHQSSVSVISGQHVVRGEYIGAMGSTGNSTGPHLHFETWVNGNPVNPRQFLG